MDNFSDPARHATLLRGLSRLAVLLLIPVAISAHARGFGLLDDDEEDLKSAKEVVEAPVKLPPFPVKDKLLPFPAGPVATQSFAVDPGSLTVDSGEIRYTLVATSSSGAQSISYEGLRCATFEVRRYAFGRKDGTFAPSQDGRWRPISFLSANRPQAILAQDYFCQERTVAGKSEQMLDRIRYKRPIIGDNYIGN